MGDFIRYKVDHDKMEKALFKGDDEVKFLRDQMKTLSNRVNKYCANGAVWRMDRFSKNRFVRKFASE